MRLLGSITPTTEGAGSGACSAAAKRPFLASLYMSRTSWAFMPRICSLDNRGISLSFLLPGYISSTSCPFMLPGSIGPASLSGALPSTSCNGGCSGACSAAAKRPFLTSSNIASKSFAVILRSCSLDSTTAGFSCLFPGYMLSTSCAFMRLTNSIGMDSLSSPPACRLCISLAQAATASSFGSRPSSPGRNGEGLSSVMAAPVAALSTAVGSAGDCAGASGRSPPSTSFIYVLVQGFVPAPPVQFHPQALLNCFVRAVHRLNYDDGDGPGGIDLLRQRRGCRDSQAA